MLRDKDDSVTRLLEKFRDKRLEVSRQSLPVVLPAYITHFLTDRTLVYLKDVGVWVRYDLACSSSYAVRKFNQALRRDDGGGPLNGDKIVETLAFVTCSSCRDKLLNSAPEVS